MVVFSVDQQTALVEAGEKPSVTPAMLGVRLGAGGSSCLCTRLRACRKRFRSIGGWEARLQSLDHGAVHAPPLLKVWVGLLLDCGDQECTASAEKVRSDESAERSCRHLSMSEHSMPCGFL